MKEKNQDIFKIFCTYLQCSPNEHRCCLGATSMRPRCDLDAASMWHRCFLNTATLQPRCGLDATPVQSRDGLSEALIRSLCHLGTAYYATTTSADFLVYVDHHIHDDGFHIIVQFS